MLELFNAEQDWINLGKNDPYYGVLSNSKFKKIKGDESGITEFFSTGENHVSLVLDVLEKDFNFKPHGTALDFGCGVGRVTAALAKHFDKVIGLDISPGMIEHAEDYAKSNDISNVIYKHSLNEFYYREHFYDFVHSYIVLQHIPEKHGKIIISNLLKALKPGGVGALHFIYATGETPLNSVKIKNVIKKIPFFRNVGNLIVGRKWDTPVMQMNEYSITMFLNMLRANGIFRSNCFVVDDWGTLGLFVFFQKPNAGAAVSPWSNPVKGRLSERD